MDVCRRHDEYQDDCFRCRIETVAIAPSAAGSPQAKVKNRVEAEWNADMPAYKRLRKQGLQPDKIDGCATLEKRATTQAEVERGHLYKSPKEAKRMEEGLRRAKDMGLVQ